MKVFFFAGPLIFCVTVLACVVQPLHVFQTAWHCSNSVAVCWILLRTAGCWGHKSGQSCYLSCIHSSHSSHSSHPERHHFPVVPVSMCHICSHVQSCAVSVSHCVALLIYSDWLVSGFGPEIQPDEHDHWMLSRPSCCCRHSCFCSSGQREPLPIPFDTTTIRNQPVILLHQVSLVSEEDMRWPRVSRYSESFSTTSEARETREMVVKQI